MRLTQLYKKKFDRLFFLHKTSARKKMLLTRRIPGLLYTYKYTVYCVAVLLATFVYFLFKWNVLCVNLQAWQHVKKMCTLYEQGDAVGSLCAPLCTSKAIHSLTCHSFKSAKEAVFSAEWHNIRLVFKSVSSKDIKNIHWYDNGVLKYPTEKQFLQTIRRIVKRKLNLTLAYETAVRLSRLKPSYEEKNIHKRHKEMDNLWYLLQDNEYLLSAIFTDKDVFPQLLGTCGPYFAVEYLEPIQMSLSVLSVSDTRQDWGLRLKLAVQILELLDELEVGFREPFQLCNFKSEHFGLSKIQKKLKFVDLDEVFPRSVANALFEELKECTSDNDCEILDCRSACHQTTKKCLKTVLNNNYQVVCEKIFLGWRMSNTIIVPGLLMSQHTPSELASILRQCANPDGEDGKPRRSPDEELRKRLYNIVSEIEQSVNGRNDFFL